MSAVEGLGRFLEHTKKLDPANNPQKINGFAREFQELKDLTSKLKKDPKYSTSQGEREVNRPKNRYKDILPYDYTRIKLPMIEGVDGSDYINGNYIKGPDGKIQYLAAQGPLPRTVDDFWRLLWSHKIQVLVMVCREYEMGKLKCKRYWPEESNEKLHFAGLDISLVSKEDIGDGFVVRTLLAKKRDQEVIVTQFHYMAWPDHDVPHSADPLIELIKSFRAFTQGSTNPVCIHCSAGCGRTGTICSVDYAWSLIKSKKTEDLNLYEIVAEMRRQRIAMVQTKEQYAFVYKAVAHLIEECMKKADTTPHTYVNVETARSVAVRPQSRSPSPSSSPSPSLTQHENYENFEFVNSINKWKSGQCSPRPPRKPEMSQQNGHKKISKQKSSDCNNSFTPIKQKTTSSGNTGHTKPAPNSYVNVSIGSVGNATSSSSSVTQVNNVDACSKPPVERRPQPCGGDGGYEVLPLNSRTAEERKLSRGNLPSSQNGFSGCNVGPQPKKEVPEGLLIDFGTPANDQPPPMPDKKTTHDPFSSITGSTKYQNVNFASKPELSTRRSSSPVSSSAGTSIGVYVVAQEAALDSKKELDSSYQIPNKASYQAPSTKVSGISKPDSLPNLSSAVASSGRKTSSTLDSPAGTYCSVTPSSKQEYPPTLPRSSTLKESPTSETPPVAASRSLSKAATKPKAKPRPPLQIGNNGAVSNFNIEHQTGPQGKPPLPKRPDSSPKDEFPPSSQRMVTSVEDLYASVDKTRKSLKRQASDYSAYSLATVPVMERATSEGNLHQQQSQPKSAPLYSSAQDDSAKGRFKGFMRSSFREAKESMKTLSQSKPSKEDEHQSPNRRTIEKKDVAKDQYASVGPRLAYKEVNICSPTYESVKSPPAHAPSSNLTNEYLEDFDDAPAIPVKTTGAFLPPEANGGVSDNVESQSPNKPGSLERGFDRFRSKAMNLLSAVPEKVNLGMPTKRSSDLGSGSITTAAMPTVADLGYMKRVAKPKGGRPPPKDWPSLSRLTALSMS